MDSFDYRVSVSPDVISQEVLLGETLLMNTQSLAYFGLDELGSAIWRELEFCHDLTQVFDRIQAKVSLDTRALERKFSGIIRGLEMSGIIVLEPLSNINGGCD